MSVEIFRTRLGVSGPRVAFLHGLFGQGRNWMTLGKELSGSARVSLIDLPDHGRSGWSTTFDYAEAADAVAEALRADSGGAAYALVGHSMGGKVAMTVALRHPELVERLCVVDVSPVVTGQLSGFGGYVTGMQAIDLAALHDRQTADRLLAAYVPDVSVRGFLLQNLRRDGNRWRWQMNLQLLGDSLDVLGSWPDPERPPYSGPVLWVAGANSRYVQPEHGPAMRALFPRVRLVIVKGAGHWVHADQPAVFAATLRHFLGLPLT